jgi:hypothetical protein
MTPWVKCCFDLGSARDSRAMLGDPPSISDATKTNIFRRGAENSTRGRVRSQRMNRVLRS